MYFYHFVYLILCFFEYNLIIMTSSKNNFYTLEDINKIKNTNLYRVLQDIEKEYPVVRNINDVNNVEDYVPYHISCFQSRKYLHRNGLTELFHRMSNQTHTECCPLMIESSNIIYINIDYKIKNNKNNQDLVGMFNTNISNGIINNFKSIVKDINPVYITLFPSTISFDEKNKYYKYGAHCFIFLDKYISKEEYRTKLISKIDNDEELNKMFDKFKDSIQLDEDKELKVSSLIDDQCFKRQGSMIFPLAQKSVDSREYKIVEGDLSKIIIPKQKHC